MDSTWLVFATIFILSVINVEKFHRPSSEMASICQSDVLIHAHARLRAWLYNMIDHLGLVAIGLAINWLEFKAFDRTEAFLLDW